LNYAADNRFESVGLNVFRALMRNMLLFQLLTSFASLLIYLGLKQRVFPKISSPVRFKLVPVPTRTLFTLTYSVSSNC
jgi:hypothetical protein